MTKPDRPKIYHIAHVDRLPSIIAEGYLWCDANMAGGGRPGTLIGISSIKERRLKSNLSSHPDLRVGDCVPFYFCPRSVMLYLISMKNYPDLTYRGGQEPIIHLEADFHQVVRRADRNDIRWAFTSTNAGSSYFEDYSDIAKLDKLSWDAIQTTNFRSNEVKEGKQAEFLVEGRFPWNLVSRIGVHSRAVYDRVVSAVQASDHRPSVEIRPDWYY